ncbi:hypothetical protein HMPREF9072_00616 [Capnocytophaga sp. oral taxon 324 str. F0483]|nr:hypothetical protein HMPREF9072_00616 [Capnocytophaga sp. oral taxon 324 str. F0483]
MRFRQRNAYFIAKNAKKSRFYDFFLIYFLQTKRVNLLRVNLELNRKLFYLCTSL